MRYFFCVCIIVIVACHAKSKRQSPTSLLDVINIDTSSQKETWTKYSLKDSIPFPLEKELDSLSKEKFTIANRDEPFQETDAVLDKLPWRQLRYLGKSGTVWIMTYKHGGIGLHYHLIICKIIDNNIKFFKTGVTTGDLETISQIKNALSSQKILFRNLEWDKEVDKI
jgi:hypothetical protein